MSSEEKINPSQAANLALNTITSKIRLLADMPAENCKMAVAGLEPIINANFSMVMDACNEQVDEFNALIDELEKRDSELFISEAARASLRGQLNSAEFSAEAGKHALRDQIEELETQLFNAQRQANSVGSKLEASMVTVRQLEREIKAYKELDPAGMKNRIKEKDKTLEELRAAIAKHKSNEASYRKQILGLENRIKEMIGVSNMQDAELSRRAEAIAELEQNRDVKATWYRYFNQTFYGDDGIGWNVYVVDHGLRESPGLFSANELSDLHQLCDTELTKRDAAVCGGQKYLDATWFERGELPPVGTVCEVSECALNSWRQVLVKGYFDGQVWLSDGDKAYDVMEVEFRPIRTERDVLLSVIVEEMNHYDTDGKLADAILAAGFKRDGGA